MKLCYLFYIVIFYVVRKSNTDTFVWLESKDIRDPVNWKENKTSCDGLVFNEEAASDIIIDELNLKSLTLPSDGSLIFHDGSSIVFDGNSTDPINCVVLKPIVTRTEFYFPGWNNSDDPDNPAVPFIHRIPSRHLIMGGNSKESTKLILKFDDVIIPQGNKATLHNRFMVVKSLSIAENGEWTNITSMYNGPLGLFAVRNFKCTDPTGCKQFDSDSEDVCDIEDLTDRFSTECSNPIEIMGFCDVPQCGAEIIIHKYKFGFRLSRIKRKLKDFRSYTFAAKVTPDENELIQIVFAEKEFTGQSVIDATEFYNMLQADASYFVADATITVSGMPLNFAHTFASGILAIVLGTLLTVASMFALLFLAYSPLAASWNLRNRILGNRPLATFIMRYDNIEDRIESQSVADSTLNLNSSFENPLYEQRTSRRNNDTVATLEVEQLNKDQESGAKTAGDKVEEDHELSQIEDDQTLLIR